MQWASVVEISFAEDGRFCMDMAILRPSAYKLVVAWLRNMLWYGHGDVDVYRSHISFFYSYVFGMFAAMCFFHETIPLTRWAGVLLIMVGCFLVVK